MQMEQGLRFRVRFDSGFELPPLVVVEGAVEVRVYMAHRHTLHIRSIPERRTRSVTRPAYVQVVRLGRRRYPFLWGVPRKRQCPVQAFSCGLSIGHGWP